MSPIKNIKYFIILLNYVLVLQLGFISCQNELVHVVRNLKDLYSYGDPASSDFVVIQPNFDHYSDRGINDGNLLFLEGFGEASLDLSQYFGDVNSIAVMYRTNVREEDLKLSYILSDGSSEMERKLGIGTSAWEKTQNDVQLVEFRVKISSLGEKKKNYFLVDQLEIQSTQIDICREAGYFTSVNWGHYYFCKFSTVYDRWLMTRFKCPIVMGSQQVFDEKLQKCVTTSATPPTTTTTSSTTTAGTTPDVTTQSPTTGSTSIDTTTTHTTTADTTTTDATTTADTTTTDAPTTAATTTTDATTAGTTTTDAPTTAATTTTDATTTADTTTTDATTTADTTTTDATTTADTTTTDATTTADTTTTASTTDTATP